MRLSLATRSIAASLLLLFSGGAVAERTFKTLWNAQLTFSWEREGRDLEILDYYGPPLADARFNKMALKDPTTKAWKAVDSAFFKKGVNLQSWQLLSRFHRRAFMVANGLRYGDLKKLPLVVKPADAAKPKWLAFDSMADALQSETNDHPPYLAIDEQMKLEEEWETTRTRAEKPTKAGRTWETAHKRFGTDLDRHLIEVEWLKGAFGGKALGQSIHMHVAFRRPAFRRQLGDKTWATARAPKVFGEQLAAFASLLNDRASLVSFAQKAATIHNKYLGPYDKKWIPGLARRVSQEFIPYVVRTVARTTGEGSTAVESGTYYNVVSQRGVVAKNVVAQFELKLRKLHDWPTSEKYADDADGAKATALRALLDDSIENPDPQGHQVGSWKFAKIALRHHYGDPEILGFEFRSTLDPNVLTVFEKTVAFLTTWNFTKPSTADVMLGAATSIPEYTIARVLTLDHVGEAACAKGSKPFRAFLKKLGEDLEAAGASTIPMGGLSGLRAGWCIPFVAWEAYPTLVRMRTEIEVARATFDAQVAGLAVTSATRGPKALQKLVEAFVSRWAKATRLDLQL